MDYWVFSLVKGSVNVNVKAMLDGICNNIVVLHLRCLMTPFVILNLFPSFLLLDTWLHKLSRVYNRKNNEIGKPLLNQICLMLKLFVKAIISPFKCIVMWLKD